jgi:hypothetical protein
MLEEIYYKYVIGKKIVGKKYEDIEHEKIFGKFVLKKIDLDSSSVIQHNEISTDPNETKYAERKTCNVLVKNEIIVKILYIE